MIQVFNYSALKVIESAISVISFVLLQIQLTKA